MPIQFVCRCGKRLVAPERRRGTRSRCPACGAPLTVPNNGASPPTDTPRTTAQPKRHPAQQTPPDDDLPIPVLDEESLPTPKKASAPPIGESTFQRARGRRRRPPARRERRPHTGATSYASDLRATLLFPGIVNNLIIFAIVWLILCLRDLILPYAWIFGAIGWYILYGWYCAYRFEVIASAASGDDELPRFSLDEIVPAMARWWGTWAVVFVPALVYVLVWKGVWAPTWLSGAFGEHPADLFESPESTLFCALVLAGLFLWPITALCVAVGGFSTLSRYDLIVLTVLKSLPAYLLTAVVVMLAFSGYYVTMAVQFAAGRAVAALVIAVGLYLELVALRMIGLYYHHFKHRFAWSWG